MAIGRRGISWEFLNCLIYIRIFKKNIDWRIKWSIENNIKLVYVASRNSLNDIILNRVSFSKIYVYKNYFIKWGPEWKILRNRKRKWKINWKYIKLKWINY